MKRQPPCAGTEMENIMGERKLISAGQHEVYKVDDTAVKVFAKAFPKAEVLNEALNTARVEDLGLHIPRILAVSVVEDGRWAITKEFVNGKTLHQLMQENPDKIDEYLDKMVDLHLEVHSKRCPLLNKLKEKMVRQIQSLDSINEITRYDLLTRLDGMPKHNKLCHGDFSPHNIIVDGDDWYIIDWVHATQGNASADVARTYLLLALEDLDMAYKYLNLFCEKTNTPKAYVQGWLPLVAAAQMTKNRPEERELLQTWINVCDYE